MLILSFLVKFNGTVPGTFQLNSDDTQQSTGPTDESVNISVNSVSTTVIVTVISVSTGGSVGTLFYILMIGVGGGMIIIVCTCILIGFSVRRKRKSHTSITDATLQTNNGSYINAR